MSILEEKSRYVTIPVSAIDLGERRRTDYGDLAKLAAGIKRIGLLHPIIVERNGDPRRYRLITGGRRFKAAQLLKWEQIPARLVETLNEKELHEIELEENDNRKDFTGRERKRTFEASKRMVEDAKKAGTALSSRTDDKQPKRGRKPSHGVAKEEVAEALGVAKATVVNAEQHVETAEQFPFMKGSEWRQSHVLACREELENLPEPERDDAVGVLTCAKLLDPATAVDLLENITAKTPDERAELYGLSKSADPRDRSKALSIAAAKPPLPDPRLNAIDIALGALGRATKPFPNDPLTPELRRIIESLRRVKSQVEAVSYDARRDANKQGAIQ